MFDLYDKFANTCKEHPDKIAVDIGDDLFSYGNLISYIEDFSDLISQKGVKQGTIVGVLMSRSVEYVIAVFALMKIGAIIVPFSIYYSEEERNSFVSKSDIDYLIVDNSSFNAPCHTIVLEDYHDLKIEPPTYQHNEMGDEALALFLLTSGSTGNPKISMISLNALVSRVEYEVKQFKLSSKDTSLINLPLFHCVGLRMLIMSMCYGLTCVIEKSFRAERWFEIIDKKKITYTITVPSQLSDIIAYHSRNKKVSEFDLSSLNTIVSTGAPLPDSIKNGFLLIYKKDFYNLLGSSETEFIAIIKCRFEIRNEIIGLPFQGVEIQLMDKDDKGNGEIICKSNMLFSGYYNDIELTEKSFINGYFKTGDMGFIDNGLISLVGRKKNMVICSGINIYPADIEKVLLEDERITDCYAYGIHDSRCGEKLAVIVESKSLTEKDIKAICLKRLAIYQQPRDIRIVENIKRDSMGKIRIDSRKEY